MKHVLKVTLMLVLLLFTQATGWALPDATADGVASVKNWVQQHVADGESAFTAWGGSRQGSPASWAGEIVYLVFVDRFNNGDTSNDRQNLPAVQWQHQDGNDLWDLHAWKHGGDLQGIINRLDYLKDLGITFLWLTPIFHNTGDYHAYNPVDLTRIDPNFGSKELLRELVKQAHARGIRVLLDVVANHMGNNNSWYSSAPDHYNAPRNFSDKYWNGGSGAVSGQGWLHFGEDFFPPLKSQYFFSRCGANTTAEMQGTEPPSVFGDFVDGMYDFDTMNYDFQEIFTALMKYWIAYADVDGFRIDAAKHITADFIAYFSTEVRDYAKSLGKDNFYVIGEVAASADWQGRRLGNMFSNPTNPDEHGHVPAALTTRLWSIKDKYLSHGRFSKPGLNAVYDFIYSGTARDVLLNKKDISSLQSYYGSAEHATISSQADVRQNWNVLEIHDWPRFTAENKDNSWKSRLGLAFLAVSQGIPVINYGQEQGFNGDGKWHNLNCGAANDQMKNLFGTHEHALYRQDMFVSGPWRLGSTIASIDGLAYVGKSTPSVWSDWKSDPYLDRNHEVYKTARRFNYIRRSSYALKYGYTHYRWTTYGTSGVFAYSRIDNGSEVVVVVNNSDWNIGIPKIVIDSSINQVAGQKYKNLLNGLQVAWTTREGGKSFLDFGGLQIAGNSVMVFAHESKLTRWDDYLGCHLINDSPVWPNPVDDGDVPIEWVGETHHWPTDGNITADSDLWINTQSYPKGAATGGHVRYSTDGGSTWHTTALSHNGTVGNNDKWHVCLGKFAAGTTLKYMLELTNSSSSRSDDKGGLYYSASVSGGGPGLIWIGDAYHWPWDGQIDSGDDFWVNIQSYPREATAEAKVLFSSDGGGSWTTVVLEHDGTAGNNDKWHIMLGNSFPSGTVLQYRFELTGKDGVVKYAGPFSAQVN